MTTDQASLVPAIAATNVAGSHPMADDAIAHFAAHMRALPARHPRRIGLMLAQAGLLVTVACFGISIAGMNIGLVTALVGCVVAGAPLHRCVGVWWYLGLMALLALSLTQAWSGKSMISTASVPIGLFVAQIAFHPGLPHAELLHRWIKRALIATIVVGTIVGIGQFLIGRGDIKPFRIDPSGPRLSQSSGMFGLHLTQGMVMGALACLAAGLLATQCKASRWGSSSAAAVSVVISGSRGALLGFAIAVGAFLMARGRRWLFIGGGIGLGLLAVALLIMSQLWPGRFENMLAMKDGRWPIWRTSAAVTMDNPWLGAGGSRPYKDAYLARYDELNPSIPNEFPDGAPHAHNTQLSHAAEHGIPYALCWLVMLVLPLWYLRRADRSVFQAGVGVVTMALVFGQFEKLDGESSRVVWTGLGMLLALASFRPQVDMLGNEGERNQTA